MKHTIEYPTNTRMKLNLTLDAEDLAAVKPVALAKLGEKLNVPGFRQGKVPASVAEKHVDANQLNDQIAEDAASKYIVEVLQKENVQLLERPSAEVQKYAPGEQLELKAEAEILPETKLGDYKKLSAKQDKASVTDEEIDQVIDNLRRNQAEKKEVKRAAKQGDEVWINFDGFDKDGNAVQGASGKDYPLNLGSNTFIPGFEDGLIGKKADDEFDLPLTFPEDYGAANLAGAKVDFKVKVNKVNEVVLPKADDEFAKKAGEEITSLEGLKKDIKKELEARKNQEANEAYRNALLDKLIEKSEVATPDVLVKDQFNALERDAQQNLAQRGMTLENYLESKGLSKEQWQEQELRPQAEKRVKTGLILSELSKAENIEVSKGELNARLKEMQEAYPNMRDQLDTEEARRDIANRTLTEKTIERLVELNTKK